jgi:phosphatidylinositol-3-phosphatase
MENKAYGDVIGSPSAPYENRLADSCGLATNYFAVTHPSLPNYIAATSGSAQGIVDDNPPGSHPLSALSLFGQVSSGSFEESMPTNCALGDTYPYAVKHNPEAYYASLRTQCQAEDVPLTRFDPNSLPQFSFVTPNLCSDTHDCSVNTGDAWLQQFLAPIFASADYRSGRTVVFLTWDEDDSSSGNHVPLVELSAYTAPGTRTTATFNHYSLLKTTEELLGVHSELGAAAAAASMRTAFGL